MTEKPTPSSPPLREPPAPAAVLAEFFDGAISTAMVARRMYQEGAAERVGIQRASYLAYADAQATRETFLREVYAALLLKFDSTALASSGAASPASLSAYTEIDLRAAWEAGFRLCRSYGDNHAHWRDEQRERCWLTYKFSRELVERENPPNPPAASVGDPQTERE